MPAQSSWAKRGSRERTVSWEKVAGDPVELDRLFDFFDTNQDGQIDDQEGEYRRLVAAVAEYVHTKQVLTLELLNALTPKSSPEMEKTEAWVREVLDENRDGVITKQEFTRNLLRALGSPLCPERLRAKRAAAEARRGSAGTVGLSCPFALSGLLKELLDKIGDMGSEEKEWRRAAEALFQHLDQDKNEVLEGEEYQEVMETLTAYVGAKYDETWGRHGVSFCRGDIRTSVMWDLDVDFDGTVTKEEFMTNLRGILEQHDS